MDKWICIAVCFLISVLIYYLLKSYGINNIIEGQCADKDSGVCNFNYEGSAQNICNSIIDPPCGEKYPDILCTDICDSQGLPSVPYGTPIPLSTFDRDSALDTCCDTDESKTTCQKLDDLITSSGGVPYKNYSLDYGVLNTKSKFQNEPWTRSDWGDTTGDPGLSTTCCNNFSIILDAYSTSTSPSYTGYARPIMEPWLAATNKGSEDGYTCNPTKESLIDNYKAMYASAYNNTNGICREYTGDMTVTERPWYTTTQDDMPEWPTTNLIDSIDIYGHIDIDGEYLTARKCT